MASVSGDQTSEAKTVKRSKGSQLPFIATLLLLISGIAGFGWYYYDATGQITDLNGQVSDLVSARDSLQGQMLSAQGQAASLQTQLDSANSRASSLQNQLNSANSQISSLQSQLNSGSGQVSSLQTQLTAANDQISTLQNLLNLNASSVKANQVTINQSSGQNSQIISFVAPYAGYITVTGTSTTTNGYISVFDSFSGYPDFDRVPFGTGTSLIIPVLPGTVSVYFGNSNLIGGATATITVTYFS